MKEKIDHVINFDFEEVNAAVFRNAQIYRRKKVSPETVCVIVPHQFQLLFKNADVLAVIGRELFAKFGVRAYRDILDFGCAVDTSLIGRLLRKARYLSDKTRMACIWWSRLLGRSISVSLYTRLYRSLRQRRFYVDNGLERYCLNALAEKFGEFRYTRVADFLDFSSMCVREMDINKHFSLNFAYLRDMIRDGNLYDARMENIKLFDSLRSNLPALTQPETDFLRDFVLSDSIKVMIRTRNFPNKAREHNSSLETFTGLAKALTDKGVKVLNLGCPLLKLGIESPLYLEIDHNLPLETELAACQNASAVAMTAGAGLFTAFAASRIRIIQLDNEWSELLSPPVFLMDARRDAGLKDLDIRPVLAERDYDAAASLICSEAGAKDAMAPAGAGSMVSSSQKVITL